MGKAAAETEDVVIEAEIAQADQTPKAANHLDQKGKMPVHKALDPKIKANNSQEGPKIGPKAAVAVIAHIRAGHATEAVLGVF